MMPILIALPGAEAMAARLARALRARVGNAEIRRFPDGESYVRIRTKVADRKVVVVAELDRPDEKFLPLLFLCSAVRDLGALEVGLVCPYLPYMRQDKRFKPGEAVTSEYFAKAVSAAFDWLVTVDPHLHRRKNLSEIYSIPSTVAHAAPLIADWIRSHVPRRGRKRTLVLVDDIVSTARTMIETVKRVRAEGGPPPWCIAVHALFAGDALIQLRQAGAGRVVSCNTVTHTSNGIDTMSLLARAIASRLKSRKPYSVRKP